MKTKSIQLNEMQMHTTGYALQRLIDSLMSQRQDLEKGSDEYSKLSKRIGWCIIVKQKITK